MLRYVFKRIGIGLVTLLALIVVTFLLVHLMPGNPFDIANLTPSNQEEMMHHYGLDRPVLEQLGQYIGNLLHGDFGISFKKSGVSVSDLIVQKAPATMRLGGIAFLAALVLGTLSGIHAAVTGHDAVRGAVLTFTTLGISVPNYVLALVLMLVFGVQLKWFPVLGLGTPVHYVLPVTALAVYPLAQISRLVKSSFSEAMQQDYVVMAKAKGIAPVRVTMLHILKNAMIPVITAAGPMIAFLLTGSFVVETIFTIPGIGREFVTAVSNRDYTVVMGLTIFIGALIILCNLIADLLCALIDPRIKLTD
ncbi:MAG: ABC transporter permease [Oscillospiraceae bacterium]|nr:ABC transporter permease [Oscillospiraceae bacterium]